MPSFATGLARGIAGFQQGRQQREQEDYERGEQEKARQRQAMLDERQRVQMEQQAEMMRAANARAEASDRRQGELDQRNAYEGGYRPADNAKRMGDALAPMQGAQGAGVVPSLAILAGLGNAGADMQQRAASPAFTMGGKGMAKIAESEQERAQRIQQQQREGEQMAAREQEERRDLRNFEQQKEIMRYSRSLQPTPQREPKLIQGNDGNMYEYRGGKLVAVPTEGGQPGAFGAGAGGGKPATEGERRAAALLSVAEREHKVMEDLGTPSFLSRVAQDAPLGVGRAFMGDKARQYEAAAQAFASSYLYTVSGATANPGEVKNLATQILPQPLDDANTVKAKTERRAQMLEAMRGIGGRAALNGAAPDVRNDAAQTTSIPNDPRSRAAYVRMKREGYTDEEIAQYLSGGR